MVQVAVVGFQHLSARVRRAASAMSIPHFLVLFLVPFSSVLCQKHQSRFNPSIIQDSRDLPQVDGAFGFLYRTEDGIAHGAVGEPGGQVHGRYTYTDPTGLKVNFNYNAGSQVSPGYNYDKGTPTRDDYPRPQPARENHAPPARPIEYQQKSRPRPVEYAANLHREEPEYRPRPPQQSQYRPRQSYEASRESYEDPRESYEAPRPQRPQPRPSGRYDRPAPRNDVDYGSYSSSF